MYSYIENVIKINILLTSILLVNFLHSQEKNKTDLLNVEIQKTAINYKSYNDFYKSASFFFEEEWDSTLVYAMRHINTSINDSIMLNYAHYFRGFGFEQKKIFDQAQKEFNLISSEFEYYFLVKKRLGEIALEKNEFKKAISYLEPLTKLKDSQYAYLSKSSIFQNLGLCYNHLGEFQKAEAYLVKNVKVDEKRKDTLNLITAYGSIANLYYEQYKDDLAIPYFEKAYQLSKSIKNFEAKRITTINMAVVEENRKDYVKALKYRKEYEQWKDSLNDQNKIYEVAQIEKEFAVKQKQQEVNLLQVENRAKIKERNGLLYSALTLLILLGLTFYFYKEKIKTNKLIVSQKEKLDELNATKDKLFSIVSHDLRSSVNALKVSNGKLLENLEEKNLEALDGMLQNNSAIVNGAYNLLDNLLHWALLQTKQSYFEIDSIRLYFIIEQIAYNYKPLMQEKGIFFENTILKKDIVGADQESLKIILRNLFDNAIKFSENGDFIKVYSESKNDRYCDLIVEDSGLGMTKEKQEELLRDTTVLSKKENEDIIGTGLGLQLCKSMIKKNKGIFSIDSELGKGTKMIVSLPKIALNG